MSKQKNTPLSKKTTPQPKGTPIPIGSVVYWIDDRIEKEGIFRLMDGTLLSHLDIGYSVRPAERKEEVIVAAIYANSGDAIDAMIAYISQKSKDLMSSAVATIMEARKFGAEVKRIDKHIQEHTKNIQTIQSTINTLDKEREEAMQSMNDAIVESEALKNLASKYILKI